MKIENLVEKDTVLDNDYLIVDGTDGTKKAKKSTFLSELNSKIDSRITQSEIFKGNVVCEANVQKMVTAYTIPEGYALIAFDIQVSGTNAASKMVSFYHTSTNIYMCVDVAQTYKVTIVATYLKL